MSAPGRINPATRTPVAAGQGWSTEDAPSHIGRELVILEGRHVLGRLDDVSKTGSGIHEDLLDPAKDELGLGGDIALAHEAPSSSTAVRPEVQIMFPAMTAGE
jgi:hypothetical protein